MDGRGFVQVWMFPERCVSEWVPAVVGQGSVADAEGVVETEGGGRVADLVEAFDADGGNEEGLVLEVL